MDLFGKKKDLILKITNLVLCLWLIGSITIFYMNIVDFFVLAPEMSYEEFKAYRCYYEESIHTEDGYCENQYQNHLSYEKTNKYNKQKILWTSIGNIVIVSGTLYLLNKKRKEEK